MDVQSKIDRAEALKGLRDHPAYGILRDLLMGDMVEVIHGFLTARSAEDAWEVSLRGRALFGVLESIIRESDGSDDLRRELAERSEASFLEQHRQEQENRRRSFSPFPQRHGVGLGP